MKITIERVVIVALGIWILFLVNCRGNKNDVVEQKPTIVIPEVVDNFDAVVPKQTPIIKWKKGDTQYYAVEDTSFLIEQERKIQFYKNANDSLQSKLYADAIELKDYSQDFIKYKDEIKKKDTIYKINVSGVVSGTILNMKADYTKFADTIKLPYQKTFRYRVLGGGEVGINKELNQGVIKANLMYQNKKGNIISGSYQKIGSQEYYLAGYNFNLFTREK